MELVGFGDLHLKPRNTAIKYDALELPPETDAVVVTGDIIHRTGPDDIEEGRKFFRRLNEFGRPIVCVPGNHDPLGHFESLIEEFETATLCHDQVVTIDNGQFDPSDSLTEHSFVGVGCELSNCEPEISILDFDSLNPRTATDRRYAADRAASDLEDAVYQHVCGNATESELLDELNITPAEQSRFNTQLQDTIEEYERIRSLLSAADGQTVFLSHVPPYNTPLDRHHSIGQREADLEGLHVGSLGQKLALRELRPIAALSGHSHNGKYQHGIGDKERPHLLNFDFQRPVRIRVDGVNDVFSFDFK